LEAVDSCGIVFPVSVWMKKLTWEEEPRCIAVMEPVERKTAIVLFDTEVQYVISYLETKMWKRTFMLRVGSKFCNPIVQCKH